MADKETFDSAYPLPVYRFVVALGDDDSMTFSEVSGLDVEYDPITYKDGLGTKHMPGMATDVNITLKRGIMVGKRELWDWISKTKLNYGERKDLTISLIDKEGGDPLVTWKVLGAFPTKLTAPTLDGNSNEVAVETLELRADDVQIEFA